ncbi:MAG: DMT family transporter [Microlunatus sp.]|nr:DMT family transporter [Microlunatus sp.]MDN5771084.1 DMT family transporter [Microlunatus sp.]
MTRRGWLLFGTLGLVWGIPYLFIRIAVTELDPVVIAGGRTALGAVILLPFALRAKALRPVLSRWRWLLLFAAVEIIGPWVLLGHAETRLNSSTTGLLIAMVPIVAAIILTITGQDRLGPRRISGLALGLLGVALLVGLDVHLDDLVAVGQILCVVVGYALGPIIITRRLADLPAIGVITGSLVIATAVYAPFAVVLRPTAPVSGAAIGSVVVLAVACTAVAFMVMFALVAEAGPARMTLITYVNPAVAITLGALVLSEPFTVGLLFGFPLIVAGSILGTWRSVPPAGVGQAGASPKSSIRSRSPSRRADSRA